MLYFDAHSYYIQIERYIEIGNLSSNSEYFQVFASKRVCVGCVCVCMYSNIVLLVSSPRSSMEQMICSLPENIEGGRVVLDIFICILYVAYNIYERIVYECMCMFGVYGIPGK